MSRNALWFNNGFAIFPSRLVFCDDDIARRRFMRHPLRLKTMLWMDFSAARFALLISSRANRKVILYQDAIEVCGWFSTRKLRRDEILGRRMGPISAQGGGSYYIIVPADESAGELGLPPHMTVDKVFLLDERYSEGCQVSSFALNSRRFQGSYSRAGGS
jgi:hypothetical protein